jgi:hypothetical protein
MKLNPFRGTRRWHTRFRHHLDWVIDVVGLIGDWL